MLADRQSGKKKPTMPLNIQYCTCNVSNRVLMVIVVECWQSMIFTSIIILITVISIDAYKRCRSVGPEMYFCRFSTHDDGTVIRYWSSVIKQPLISYLFSLDPHLNFSIIGDWFLIKNNLKCLNWHHHFYSVRMNRMG